MPSDHGLRLLETLGRFLDQRPDLLRSCLQLVLPPVGATRFESIEFPDRDLREKRSLKPLGSDLPSVRYQIDQVASFIVLGDSYPAAVRSAESAPEGTT